MKINKFKSLNNFVDNYNLKSISKGDLIISDIDGVFFKGIFDPREIIGLIDNKTLKSLERLLKTQASFWIMTNRIHIFRKFPYIKQLSRTVKKITSVKPYIYSNCSKFLEDNIKNYIIIMNAKKPSLESQKVVEKGIANFSKVLYIGSQDLPFFHNDLKLISKVKESTNSKNLEYIEISYWKK